MREIAIAEGVDELDKTALLHGEINGNAQAQIVDQPPIDKVDVGTSPAIEVGERVLYVNLSPAPSDRIDAGDNSGQRNRAARPRVVVERDRAEVGRQRGGCRDGATHRDAAQV